MANGVSLRRAGSEDEDEDDEDADIAPIRLLAAPQIMRQ
jgi:hypothetical protein